MIALPLRLAYKGASTIEDANGETVAECPDNETAAILVEIVNAAQRAATIDRPAVRERAELIDVMHRAQKGAW